MLGSECPVDVRRDVSEHIDCLDGTLVGGPVEPRGAVIEPLDPIIDPLDPIIDPRDRISACNPCSEMDAL